MTVKAELLYGAETRGLTEEMKQRLQVVIKKCLLGTSCGFGGLKGSEFKSCGNSRAAADKGVERTCAWISDTLRRLNKLM